MDKQKQKARKRKQKQIARETKLQNQFRLDFARYVGTDTELDSIRRQHEAIDGQLAFLDAIIR